MGWLANVVWLADARRKVRERPPARHAEVRRWWAVARARLRVAERLDPTSEAEAMVPLLRDGMLGLAGAAVAAAEGDVKPEDVASVEAAWAALERVWPKLGARPPLGDLAAARELVAATPPIDAAPTGGAEGALAADRLARAVGRAIEPRSARWLGARAALQVCVPAAALVAAAATLIPPLFSPPDLALGKPVRLSSSHPGSLAPATGEWLVNGRVERIYGVATANEQTPWMLIDLEKPTAFGRIVVYNRGDGYFSDCLPLEVSIGDTPSSLRRVGLRHEVFTQFSPWVILVHDRARYVKLTTHKHAACALSEVAVYSR